MNKYGLSAYRVSGLTLCRALALLVAVVLAGCVQQTPVPYYAHLGDTIILGLGGIQRNVTGEQHLSISDLLITATPVGGGAAVTLPASSVFKAFPDYNSSMNSNVFSGLAPAGVHLVPFDGGWFVTVSLPNNGTLTAGAYTLSITSPSNKLVNTKYSTGFSEGDLTNIPLQIDAGASAQSSNYTQQFTYYQSATSLDISPNTLAGITAASGLQLAITYPQARYNPVHLPMVLPYSHNPFLQLAQNVIDNGDGTKTMMVMLSTQQAFVAKANQTAMTPLLSDLSLRLVFFVANGQSNPTAAQAVAEFQIDPARSHYYDTSGAVISSMQPVLTYHTN